MELLLCVPPQNQRQISPLAIRRHKSASMGYVSISCPLAVLCLVCALCELAFVFKDFFLLPACLDQVCSGSICAKYNLEVCTCASQDGQDEAAELCHVCCMEKSK